ncbi:MAG: BREX-3 system P-loop-containing protein BrxF [Acidobacteria bacterium]|nr:BREX-3 system P-loop-containing protein BrxF [Acidobacteriota bacterium]
MAEALPQKVLARIDGAKALYHRLILVVAPGGSGKTEALREVAASTGARLVNLNLELSRRMLDLTERERALRLPDLLNEVVGKDEPLVLLDNIEILFDAALKQDPLRLLQGVSRNRTIVAAWNGTLEKGYLTYAAPEHPEHRRYSRGDRGDVVVVGPDVVS